MILRSDPNLFMFQVHLRWNSLVPIAVFNNVSYLNGFSAGRRLLDFSIAKSGRKLGKVGFKIVDFDQCEIGEMASSSFLTVKTSVKIMFTTVRQTRALIEK